jgi:hypothetical protein
VTVVTAKISPYNFVPLSPWVHRPDDLPDISHDIPLKDGYCGYIDYHLKAETDFLIGGDEVPKSNGRPKKVKPACLFDGSPTGEYFIPGSSIQGMLRNVLEIASYSALQEVAERHFGVRDFLPDSKIRSDDRSASAIGDYKAVQASFQDDPRGAWLSKTSDEDFPAELVMVRYVKKNEPHDFKDSAMVFMGKMMGKLNVYLFEKKQAQMEVIKLPRELLRGFLDAHGDGDKPDTQRQWHFQAKIKSSNKLRNSHKQNYDLGHAVPVFAWLDKQGTVKALSLAKLPILPSKRSVHQAINNTSSDHLSTESARLDMAERLFGTVRKFVDSRGEEYTALKKRVVCEPSRWDGDKNVLPREHTVVQSTPRPTFYPYYLKQESAPQNPHYLKPNHAFNTWLSSPSERIKINGWKRYPVRPEAVFPEDENPTDKIDIKTTLCALPPQKTAFKGRVNLHNIGAIELGSVLWAMTFGDANGHSPFRHSLGRGKPFGMGVMRLSMGELNLRPNDAASELPKIAEKVDAQHFILKFTAHMNKAFSGTDNKSNWESSEQINLLKLMANIEAGEKLQDVLDYPGDFKAYATIKKSGRVLPDYQQLLENPSIGKPPENLANKSDQRSPKLTEYHLKHHWLTQEVERIASKDRAPKIDVLKGQTLAKCWSDEDTDIKAQVLAEIKQHWIQIFGEWKRPGKGSARKAFDIYTAGDQ